MNVLFTGERRVGKSSALRRLAALCPGTVRGFVTVFYDRGATPKELYIQPWGEKPEFCRERLAARLYGGHREVYPEVFDTFGAALVAQSGADAIIMDELGFLEEDASVFGGAVRAALLGSTPVIGVIREGLSGTAAEPAELARVLTVTRENRSGIHTEAAKILGWYGEDIGHG